MQFCLCGSNNVLHVFSLKFASFLRYYVCEKHFSKAILWGPFVERKTTLFRYGFVGKSRLFPLA